jgi:hypothetical protein
MSAYTVLIFAYLGLVGAQTARNDPAPDRPSQIHDGQKQISRRAAENWPRQLKNK